MATAPVNPIATSPAAPISATPPAAGQSGAGFHLPSYLLGLITALLLAGAALLFWPRPQPAALQLQAPPTLAPTAAASTPAPTPAQTAVATLAPTSSPLVVFVSGAVAQPGLYTLAPSARIGDAIAAAGGLLPGVDGALINQAQPLLDGAQLHIPAPPAAPDTAPADASATPPTIAPVTAPPANAAAEQPPAGLSIAQPLALPTPTTAPAAAPVEAPASRAAPVALPAAGALINVNTASGAELESLPGIGPAKAQAIIDNRPFANVEELDRVPGIGPATLDQIRALVTTE